MLIKMSEILRKHLYKCLRNPEIAGYFLQTMLEAATKRKDKTLLISVLIDIATANKVTRNDLINQMPKKQESRAYKKASLSGRRYRLDKNRPNLKKVIK